jgi:hypothetical protein
MLVLLLLLLLLPLLHLASRSTPLGPDQPRCVVFNGLQEGFVSTHEAVARALAHLEGGGPELLESLLAPLRLMTSIQVA